MERHIIAIQSDEHAGHEVGLLAPGVRITEPNARTLEQGDFQRLAWSVQERMIGRVRELAGKKAPVHLVRLGDPVHGVRHSDQLQAIEIADQLEIAVANILPWFALPVASVRMLAGTSAHELGAGSATKLLAGRLAALYPKIDVRPAFHVLTEIGGALIDACHHGPGQSRREWLRGNTARYYLKSLVDHELRNARRPPDLALRGHIHDPVNEVITEWVGGRWLESRLVVCPPMSGLTEYARQVTQGVYEITVGGVIVVIQDGKVLAPEFMTETIDLRLSEVL